MWPSAEGGVLCTGFLSWITVVGVVIPNIVKGLIYRTGRLTEREREDVPQSTTVGYTVGR